MKLPHVVLVLLVCLLGGMLRAQEVGSPDGRFVFRELQDSEWGVVEKATSKTVLASTENIQPIGKEIAAVWAKDSRHVAINLRAGGRWITTVLYAWTGKGFTARPTIDELLETRMEVERQAELKRLKLPADTYLRRIWDTHRTLRWRDAQTVEVLVDSIRSYVVDKETEDTTDLTRRGVFTVRFDPKGGPPKIVGRRAPTAEEEKE